MKFLSFPFFGKVWVCLDPDQFAIRIRSADPVESGSESLGMAKRIFYILGIGIVCSLSFSSYRKAGFLAFPFHLPAYQPPFSPTFQLLLARSCSVVSFIYILSSLWTRIEVYRAYFSDPSSP
jgi:hypothetical protein